MRLSKLQKLDPLLTIALWSLFRLWPLKKGEIELFVNTIAKFTNGHSIHSGFTSEKH
jgi:hypothetical protein